MEVTILSKKLIATHNEIYGTFIKWFEAQYGQRPACRGEEEDLAYVVLDARLAADTLNRCKRYDAHFDAAYKGWLGRESCLKK